MLPRGDLALEFVFAAQKAASIDELTGLLLEALGHTGIKHAFCLRIAIPGHPVRLELLFGRDDPAWAAAYSQQRCLLHDPVIQRVFANAGPIHWADIAASELTRESSRVFELAAAFGHRDGITVPVLGRRGEICAIIMTADARLDLTPNEQALLFALASVFAMRGNSLLDREPLSAPMLTPRERQCLAWAARGKSDWEIGQILTIGERTAHMFVENAKRKLGARTRRQAIVQAWQHGRLLDLSEDGRPATAG